MLTYGRTALMTEGKFTAARIMLDGAVNLMAQHYARLLGFGYVATEDAPASWGAIRAAFRHSQATGDPYPVYSGGCDRTVYLTPETNHAFRFWHDVCHVKGGFDLSHESEERAALAMINGMADVLGIDRGPVVALLYADTIGQLWANRVNGRFVADQRAFAKTYLMTGPDSALAVL